MLYLIYLGTYNSANFNLLKGKCFFTRTKNEFSYILYSSNNFFFFKFKFQKIFNCKKNYSKSQNKSL